MLTLFAIAKELEYAGIKEPDDTVDVTLLIGLPPASPAAELREHPEDASA